MRIRELKAVVDTVISRLGKDEDLLVCIDLDEPRLGAEASTEVVSAFKGCDWERDQFRLTPKEPVVRTVFKPPVKDLTNASPCPACGMKFSSGDSYCRYCGQKLVPNNR